MSYEGYEQHICANGHRFNRTCSYGEVDKEICYCGAESVWYNPVDETNGESYGMIPNAAWKHHSHGKIAIPTEKELKLMRTREDWGSRNTVLIDSGELYEGPVYSLCEVKPRMCYGRGVVLVQSPANNPCC